jgi:thiol-disulfide isomerase/thioredoxin
MNRSSLLRKACGPISVLLLALLILTAARVVYAQGYDVTPWPARRPTPDLSANDLNGQAWRLADLRGRVVLINFWASWCAPCLAEMPSLATLADAYGPQRLVVLAVNVKEPRATVQRFILRQHLSLPVLPDPEGQIARAWGVKIFPSTLLVAADGHVAGLLRGEFDWQSPAATALLAPLLAKTGQSGP